MANMLNDLDLVQPWAGALKGNVNWDEIFEGLPGHGRLAGRLLL